ncbi:MAG: ribulokinase [Clostridia bacterium]|nr:ribulokinase [Clostridia bacterium]
MPTPSLYTLGLDFGTLSVRALIVDTRDGRAVAEAVSEYAHGVMDAALPDGTPLPPRFALQHPQDYLDSMKASIREALSAAYTAEGVAPDHIAALGVDFTACTMLPVDRAGMPLCRDPAFAGEPHAYVKLWKHHGATEEADELNALAAARVEPWLASYGGTVSCEWMLPKILETLRKAPDVFKAAYRFTEAADWLSLMLTGNETHAAAFAGYKGLWQDGAYPSEDFLAALDPALRGLVGSRISPIVSPVSGIAGRLNNRGAALTGLPAGTPVALPMIDAHAVLPALGMTRAGDLTVILGTSTCHILNAAEAKEVTGICGYTEDGVIPSLCTYEAGQAAVGDCFDWFVKNCVPASYTEAARAAGVSVHAYLRLLAERKAPGESGVMALDWWNGNRSILVDPTLTGIIVGLTLATRPEDIYRALIEATAFGTKVIVEQYEAFGIPINHIMAAGGIARKDPLMMQIYADVLNRPVEVSETTQAGALGSAIYAAVAGGMYASVTEAADRMAAKVERMYTPNPGAAQAYAEMFRRYRELHDHFGKR